jgi:hypothetical protein
MLRCFSVISQTRNSTPWDLRSCTVTSNGLPFASLASFMRKLMPAACMTITIFALGSTLRWLRTLRSACGARATSSFMW